MVSHKIRVPFRLGIFLGLGDAEQIAGAGDQDEEIVAEDDEPRREIAGETRPAGLLHDIERGRDQHVAAEGEDHRRSMQRPQPAEAGPRQVEIERRPRQLRRDQQPDRKSGDAPEHRHDGGELDRAHIVVGPAVDFLRRQRRRAVEIPVDDRERRRQAGGGTPERHGTRTPYRAPSPRRTGRERRQRQTAAPDRLRPSVIDFAV